MRKMIVKNGYVYEVLNNFGKSNEINKFRFDNVPIGSVILMREVNIINADGRTYYEKESRPYVYLGNKSILSVDKNDNIILELNQYIVNELETHWGETDKVDSEGNYIYEPKDYETSIDSNNITGLKHRSMAQGISYAKFSSEELTSFIPLGTVNNVDELIRKLEDYSNILLENKNINNNNINVKLDLNFVYNDILVEEINAKGELCGRYICDDFELDFTYDYLNQLMLINDQDLNYIVIENFENEYRKIEGELIDKNDNVISNEIIDTYISNLENILIEVDNYVFNNIVINVD